MLNRLLLLSLLPLTVIGFGFGDVYFYFDPATTFLMLGFTFFPLIAKYSVNIVVGNILNVITGYSCGCLRAGFWKDYVIFLSFAGVFWTVQGIFSFLKSSSFDDSFSIKILFSSLVIVFLPILYSSIGMLLPVMHLAKK